MKKLLSTMLAVAMIVCTFVPMTVSAAFETIVLPTTTGESVLLEMENYNSFLDGTATKPYTMEEMKGLSDGKGIYSGSTSWNTVTLTLPLSVAEDTVFHLEMVAGLGGAFNKNYWTLDNTLLFVTDKAGTPITDENGAQIYFSSANKHYPATKATYTFMIPAGTHNLTYNIPNRGTQTGAFALDYLKFTATDATLPDVSFAEGATVSAKTSDNVAAITFTDSGVETSDSVATPVNKYLIEILAVDVSGKPIVTSTIFDAYTGDKKARPYTSYTAHVAIPKTQRGTFFAKVYPVGNTYVSQKGEPIVSDTFTVTESVSDAAIRYELENYWNYETPGTIAGSKYASGGKFVISSQNASWINTGYTCIENKNAETWLDTYEMTVDVNIPADGTYNVETVMGRGDATWTNRVSLFIDDATEPLYTNANGNMDENVSVDGSYPYAHTYMGRYIEPLTLTAGPHTAKFVITRPTQEAQPHLFVLDYIQFTPEKATISMTDAATFEMEDYAAQFVVFDEEGNTEAVNPTVFERGTTSGGGFIQKDYTPAMGAYPIKTEIPLVVKESGLYVFEGMESYVGCDGFVSLSDGTNTIEAIPAFSGKCVSFSDPEDEANSYTYAYYNIKWFGARKSKNVAYVPAGEYTMTVQFNARPTQIPSGDKILTQSGMAFCIDYVKVAPCATPEILVAANGTTTIEMDELTDFFMKDGGTILEAKVEENANANNGKLATTTETGMETGHSLRIPIRVEKAGWYDLGSVMTIKNGGWTSLIEISVNGDVVITGEKANSVEDLTMPDGETVTYLNSSYLMHRFSEKVYLEEGDNTITFLANPRTEKTDFEKAADEKDGVVHPYMVGYYIDYISLAPVAENVTIDGATVSGTVVYDETVSGKLIVAAYSGKELIGTYMTDISDTAANINTTFEEAPDTVKVFVWENLNKFAPVVAPKIFN